MKFDVKRLVELGLLRKIPVSREKAQDSIKTAESWLSEGKKNLRSKAFRSCLLSSYLAMFHSGRAVLFVNGYREKSHFAVARFLEDFYVRKNLLEKKWVEILDYYRETRHDDQYGTSFIATEQEAKNALRSAQEFVERIKALLDSY
ncbi:HEPN domain-containing protein [Candidatus Pacearchaeota archaeon]|nr:MAG: HEPN domain-containing protein [Candidatus Pacearchaeota archaeon]